jgi:hypothetical protein
MSDYVIVQSNWTSTNCLSLDLVCDVGFENTDHSTAIDDETENKNNNNDDDNNYNDDEHHSRLVFDSLF